VVAEEERSAMSILIGTLSLKKAANVVGAVPFDEVEETMSSDEIVYSARAYARKQFLDGLTEEELEEGERFLEPQIAEAELQGEAEIMNKIYKAWLSAIEISWDSLLEHITDGLYAVLDTSKKNFELEIFARDIKAKDKFFITLKHTIEGYGLPSLDSANAKNLNMLMVYGKVYGWRSPFNQNFDRNLARIF
jgi:hypothetical protein